MFAPPARAKRLQWKMAFRWAIGAIHKISDVRRGSQPRTMGTRLGVFDQELHSITLSQRGGGGKGGGGGGDLVTKSRRSFLDFTSHEKRNFIFTIFRNTEA